ncbi:MAG: MATE family efflux transporter [Oscillospiraceae bacterium]|nr:MATE family efflux transporter [Oscillospiraceae bacterium]
MAKDMTQGKEWKLILSFTLPLIGGNLLQQIYSLADSLIVGNFAGQTALASVGTSFPITFLLLALATGLTNGVGVMASQFYGAKNAEAFRKNLSTACFTLLGAGILITILGILTSRPLLAGLLQADASILDDALLYLRIYCIGLVFQFAYNTFAAILRSIGDSRSTMYFLLLATVVNIVLDLIFVQFWQVAGVAWATVIAQAVSAVTAGVYLFRKVELARFRKGQFRFHREMFGMSLRLGVPTSIQQCSVGLGMVLMQRLINSFGVDTISAITAAMKLESFAMVPIMMFYMGLSNFTGQNMGARQMDRIKRGYHQTMVMAMITCAGIILLLVFAGPYAIGLFHMNQAATAIGVEYLQTLAWFFLIFCIMYITNGVLQGSGDVAYPTAGSMTSLIVRVIVANIMATFPAIGYRSIFYSIPIGWVCGTAIVFIRYLTGKWKTKGVMQRSAAGKEEAKHV